MSYPTSEIAVFWFRRDLRLDDNRGLFHALSTGIPVLPVFIFDRNILDYLDDKDDRRVIFIHRQLVQLHEELRKLGAGLRVFYGTPEEAFQTLLKEKNVKMVFTNHDYEPYAKIRDREIGQMLTQNGVQFQTFKDQVIFEKDEVLTGNGLPYTVFTPYSKRWKERLTIADFQPLSCKPLYGSFFQWDAPDLIALRQMGFQNREIDFPPSHVEDNVISQYAEKRNFPALPATSRLSVHLRFGTISIRSLVSRALQLSESWLNELIWREFYMQVLWHFPRISEGKSFKPAYDNIPWVNNEVDFKAWCEGKTGYPIVDAGMRELVATGFMHNRVRMITASFLVKHLLIDWRWGEAWFARHLLDFDLAANNGGWQWSASSGCDAAPYFRVFNPLLQTQKFDPNLAYIKHWVPEYNDLAYIQNPIIQHEFARKRVIDTYKKALSGVES